MCDLKVCRICLRNELKIHNIDEYNLKQYYEKITNKSISKKDRLPKYICYECAALLYKFHTFREKCDYGEKVLRDMLYKGPLKYAEISERNAQRPNKFKHLTFDILVTNKRVKTFNYNHTEDRQGKENTLKQEIINEEFTEDSNDDNFACNDPESDPVDLDVAVKKNKETAIKINNTKNIITTVEVQIENVGIKEETNILYNLLLPEKSDKPKRNVKTKQIRKSKSNTKQKKIKPRPSLTDSDDETDNIELSKIKSAKKLVMSPPTKKTYKFNKPKSNVRSLAFLNSANWKKYKLSDADAMEEFQKKALDEKYRKAPYKCELCYRGFSQKSMLDRHMPQRHGESVGAHACRFCKMRFKSDYYVNLHTRTHYNKFECLLCGLVCCLENTALVHEEYHTGVKRKCPHCNKEFRHLSSFYTHLRTHRSKHMCSLCGESFVSERGLRLHKKAKHRAEIENNVVTTDAAMYCEVCKINFESKDAYQNHLDHSALHTEDNKKLDEHDDLAIIEAEPKPQEGEDKIHTHVRGLVNRKSTVEKELCAARKGGRGGGGRMAKKPTACQHCDAAFDSLSACMRHHHAEHRRKPFYSKRVICEICGASLAVNSVNAHLNQHTRRKMYTCDTCGRSFTTSVILKNHLVTHTGEKKHACTLCDKRFSHNGSLHLHYRTFHLKQPYPKRNRRKNVEKEKEDYDLFIGEEK